MALAAHFESSGIAGGVVKSTKTSPIKGRPTNAKDALLHWCYMKTRNYVSENTSTITIDTNNLLLIKI